MATTVRSRRAWYRGEQAENSQGHKPGSVTHGQRGTGDQAEGWSDKPGVQQETVSRGQDQAGSATRQEHRIPG
ncbi:unnamed protein product, partial [Staurois parvus]